MKKIDNEWIMTFGIRMLIIAIIIVVFIYTMVELIKHRNNNLLMFVVSLINTIVSFSILIYLMRKGLKG